MKKGKDYTKAPRKTQFKAAKVDGDGSEKWSFFKEGGFWQLEDPCGYTRVFESRWIDSVGLMNDCLEGHGLKGVLS